MTGASGRGEESVRVPAPVVSLCVISGVLIHPRVTVVIVLSILEKAKDDVARQLAGADPDRVTSGQAAKLMTLFAEIERLGAGGKVLFSKRAAQSIAWR